MAEPASVNASAPKPPVHVAIIMDGNGRWAKARGLPRVAGHQRGAEAARAAVRMCREFGIQYSLSNVSSLLKSLGLSTDRSGEDRSVLRL